MLEPRGVSRERAGDAAHAARLRREAELLGAARHPGVVELVGLEDDDDRPCLVTASVQGGRLSDAMPLDVEEAAGVVAALAATVADLHELGLVHGAITADHVVLDGDGRPMLRAFGWGGRAGQPPVAEPTLPDGFADPARPEGAPLSPANDVFALGALLRILLAGGRADHGDRRRSPARRATADALRVVADRATAPDPKARPGARALGAAVGHAAPGARLPRAPGEGSRLEPPIPASSGPAAGLRVLRRPRAGVASAGGGAPTPRRFLVLVGIAVGVTLGVVAIARHLGHARPPTSAAPAGRSRPVTTGGEAPGPETASPGSAAEPRCPPVTSPLAADVDGDGCPDALRFEDGVIVAGDARWAVGDPGDQPAVGDWTCRGVGTLALLRPSTGEVFVFDSWATADHDVVGALRARVEGATAIRSAPGDGDPCPRLMVDRPAGPPETVPVPRGGE